MDSITWCDSETRPTIAATDGRADRRTPWRSSTACEYYDVLLLYTYVRHNLVARSTRGPHAGLVAWFLCTWEDPIPSEYVRVVWWPCICILGTNNRALDTDKHKMTPPPLGLSLPFSPRMHALQIYLSVAGKETKCQRKIRTAGRTCLAEVSS